MQHCWSGWTEGSVRLFFPGRELHVVVNTNDPEYEHIYSIEAYDQPLDELLDFTANQSDGTVCFMLCPL